MAWGAQNVKQSPILRPGEGREREEETEEEDEEQGGVWPGRGVCIQSEERAEELEEVWRIRGDGAGEEMREGEGE